MNAEHHQYGDRERFGRKLYKEGKVFVAGSVTAIDCTIRDITRDVALVSIPMFGEVPDRFELAIPSSNRLMPVRVVGRSQEGISLVFSGPSRPFQSDRIQDSDLLIQTANEPVTSNYLARPDRLENFDKFKISPGFEFSFTPDLVYSTKGWCKIAIYISNSGEIVAHQPFLCLPLLGLRLEAAKGWLAQEVTSVRKMRRFSQPGFYDLAASDRVHCCNIILPFISENGGTLEYEAGAAHALNNLPDLKLTCIAGAGNYPSNRLPLVVPALETRRFFTEMQARGQIPELANAESQKEDERTT